MFETVYEVQFLQGPNRRPYMYRAYTPNVKRGDTVVIDVNGGGKEFSGYRLAKVVQCHSYHQDTARKYHAKLVAVIDDAYYLEQKKLSSLLAEAARSVEVHEAQVEVAEAAVIDLAKRRAALADAQEHHRSIVALADQAELARLRRLDNGGVNTPRFWADKADQAAGRELAYQKGPFPALRDAPDPLDDGGWGHC